jgi:putative ABC transport system substrate-binding protein
VPNRPWVVPLHEWSVRRRRNIIIERRYTEGNIERAPQVAAELVRLNVDVIVAVAPPNVRAAQRATSSIPIVMLAVSDPVGMGFVSSLARPGGNITSVTSAIPDGFMGKWLQLIKEALPNAARIGLLVDPANPLNYATANAEQLTAAARMLNVELHRLEIRSADDIEYGVVVNLRAAKVLGLTIPPSLTIRADEVIKSSSGAGRQLRSVRGPTHCIEPDDRDRP